MNKEVIISALYSALNLLNSEIESVIVNELKDEYADVIMKIQKAIDELEKDETK